MVRAPRLAGSARPSAAARAAPWVILGVLLVLAVPLASAAGAPLPGPSFHSRSGPAVAPVPDGSPMANSAIWWNVTNESLLAPPVVEFTEATSDPNEGGLFLEGGDDYGVSLAGSWSYLAGQWSHAALPGDPGPNTGGALAYDPALGGSVFFGGASSLSPFVANTTTYLLIDGAWSAEQLDPAPPVTVGGQMVYDPLLGGVVLFGGSGPDSLTNAAWLFSNGSWSRLPIGSEAPSPRWLFGMAFDPALGAVIVYGGTDQNGSTLNDTWSYTSGGWSEYPEAAELGVPGTSGGLLAFDPQLDTLVLAAGIDDAGAYLSGSWSFDGSRWSPLSVGGSPGSHDKAVGGWDAADGELVISGGFPSGSTEALAVPLQLRSVSAPTTIDVAVGANFDASFLGGVGPYTVLWSWGDGTQSTGDPASHAYAGTGVYTVSMTITAYLGGLLSWSGTLAVVIAPSAELGISAPFTDVAVPVAFRAEAVSGTAPFVETWQFGDGAEASEAVVDHAYALPGDYLVSLALSDGSNGTAAFNATVLVNATPVVTIIASASAEAGVAESFHAVVDGGTPPLQYAWTLPDGSRSTDPLPEVRVGNGTEANASVKVTDSAGVSAYADWSSAIAAPLCVTIDGPATLDIGAYGDYRANVSGGVDPVVIAWTYPDGSSTRGENASFGATSAGTVTLTVLAVDPAGGSANATLDVAVTTLSVLSAESIPDLSPAVAGGAIGGLVLAAVGGLLLGRPPERRRVG